MLESCPFCNIVIGRANAHLVHEWPEVIAFFPREPATLGHTLIVPREHIPDIWSLGQRLGRLISDCILETTAAIKSALDPPGLNVINSAGEVATQTVRHFHVHVVPRYENDQMGLIWPDNSEVTSAELQRALSKLALAFNVRNDAQQYPKRSQQ
jgi:histidine triad (HIT) family protein